jgi:AcrR family transcriptional regulator
MSSVATLKTHPSSDARRDSILAASRIVFARQNYAAASVEDIAAQAGIAKGTVYLYFKSKEAIYLAALLEDAAALHDKMREQMEAPASLRDKVRGVLRARLDYFKAHEEFLRLYLAEYGSLFRSDRNVPSEFLELFRDTLNNLSTHISTAIHRGEIRSVSPGALASAIFDLARGLTEKRLLGWNDLQAEDELEFVMDLLWSGLKPGPKSKSQGGR